ncbi:MAG TPA: restriction endonuclease [Solirubrobacterales bacterium]|nr:restriction endonuclease [Solirubrobacterales bacterium]
MAAKPAETTDQMEIAPIRRIPPAAEFSPGQIELGPLLKLAAAHPGDRTGLTEAIRSSFFADAVPKHADNPALQRKEQTKRAGNAVIGMGTYGLYDRQQKQLTELGVALSKLDEAEMYEELARHILTNLFGVDVIEAVRSLKARGEAPYKEPLAKELRRRGFTNLPNAADHHLILLKWLEQSGVVSGREREVDDEILKRLVGAESETMHEVLSLPESHRAYLGTIQGLCREQPGEKFPSSQIDELTIETHGEILGPDDQRKALIRDPLREAGWLELTGTTKGRGGKSGFVEPTQKLLELDPALLDRPPAPGLPADVLDQLDLPLGQVYTDLDSYDTHVKGVALELLAANMAFDLGLEPVAFRLRAAETTGGTEVDLVAEAVRLQFSRWVFQCKNTRKVDLKVATREIGVADIVHAHVIVIVTTGKFTRDTPAIRAALATATEKQLVLVDEKVLRDYRKNGPSALLRHFRKQARETMEAKRTQGLKVLQGFSS